jgi:alpha-L-glutamate ligase-like protein/uncharacterized protein (TIGR02421 family)
MFFKKSGILGINARNLHYIRPYNPKKAIKLADNKIKTKQFLSARDIPVPKLFGIIREASEIEKYDFNNLPNAFVVKPNKGYGGEGIIPIVDKRDGVYISASGKQITQEELEDHLRDIIDGRFSISNVADNAFFEQLIVADERLGKYSYEGLPDVRIVVHNLIPVMGMLRLPTKESDGKANLHMGAVGVGIDIAKGECTHIAYKNQTIPELPDGLGEIRDLKVPYWDEMLLIAAKVQLLTNLGYMAIDMCIDKNTGPVLLEINARAGLQVQLANLAPLRRRLERIEGVKVPTPTKGVRIAKDMFGNILEKEIEHLSGKQVISTEETVEIIQKKGTFRLHAKIDTGKEISILDEETAIKHGMLDNTEEYDDEKSNLKLKFALKGKRLQTIVNIEKIPSKKHKIIIGSRDLKDFLVDTSDHSKAKEKISNKEKKTPEIIEKNQSSMKKTNFREIDQKLINIDRKIKLLYHLRPLNLDSEKKKFFKEEDYNPQFEYPELKFDPQELLHQLEKIHTDDSPLGKIFENKRQEIINKTLLLDARDEEKFTEISTRLFGHPSKAEVEKCKGFINAVDMKKKNPNENLLNAAKAKEIFEKTFEKYGLKSWKVKIKDNMVANCVAGKNNQLFIKADAEFSRERIEALIVHEIETHILTAENGKMQPYDIFNRGLANYLKTQEGLAMYNVEQQRNENFEENHRALTHVVAISKAISGSFQDAFQEIIALGINPNDAFRSCLKAKRGLMDTSKKGAFTKDYIYFKGYYQVKKFIEEGGKIKDLYRGKMDIKDLEDVKSIQGIKTPKLLPTWLK